ncbi:glycosyltransferase [Aeromonas caviae]|uniref:Glycosyltransferase n=1 Tax=Aeromonas caviae TaxID=648 RepID=A0A7T4C2Z7_AERCA|nr:glycosyltransferase [Aeromonas caviae]QQA60736.1 glycosyltransferase [Aeromonas caviae]
MNRVAVLLAVYNGESWLVEQIESILIQQKVSVTFFISVDRCQDNSYYICHRYSQEHKNIILLPYGEVFGGAGKNFYRLIKDVDFSSFDYMAFSDQDDIWHQDKLFNAIEKLQQYDCYSSNVTAFWEDGREILIDKAQSQQPWDYLFEAAGPGCTYVFKKKLGLAFQAWLRENDAVIENEVSLHDWLLYAFARRYGYSWYIDAKPSMRYRQHKNNQVGTNNNLAAARKRLHLIKNQWYRNQVFSIVTLLNLKEVPIVKKGLMNGYLGNVYLLMHVNKLRRRARDRLALAFFLLFNLF